jgi:ribonucleoside-diphosphate reductase alpha chain
VIDINFYPTEAARNANQRHRPIGMGVMGLQNALYKRAPLRLSEEAVEFNDEFMEAIAYYAYEASSDLAAERGTYSSATRAPSGTAACCRRTPSTSSKRSAATAARRAARRKMDWAPVREKIARQGMRNSNVLAIAPPPPSPTSWAPRPASSRPTRTSS